MRKEKELRFLVTFDSTASAFQTDSAAAAAGLPGRLIPLPQRISAGCGFAWSAPLSAREDLMQLLESHEIDYARTLEWEL